MDSKLKRFCIVGSLSVMVLVVLLVYYLNRENAVATGQTPTPTPQTEVLQPPQVVYPEGMQTEDGYQIGYSLSAFLKDEDFFDPQVTAAPATDKEEVSMVVTSVEKDLRIQVVDEAGALVTGESLRVVLEGKGEYKDLDKDGIIYIGEIASGDYSLSLMPLENYSVPETAVKVNVKEKIEYVAIKDISVLIKTEAEIDALTEDTDAKGALEDADKSEITKLQATTANSSLGIDVSKWNKEIDWKKVKDAGVEFAIIRAGYRGYTTGSLVVDPYFEANIKGATDAGILTGVYFFTQAVNEVEAVEEASMVIELLKKYDIQYPVFIDTEGVGGNGRADNLDVATRTAVCEAFCNTIENEGYMAGVYASRNWYQNRLETEKLEHFYIWLAEYRSEPLYKGSYQMWQYTSKGQIDGIEGNVDLNISYLAQP